ncbi:hypothetical protein [Pseudonocardia sp. KRD291]|uniref:hypothetical protein n=1 Tax=Pseudonocardia sp. KRD291 TaxID=2792007 RepID=UPI001C49DFF7|nr:hypothetical protein [Pseudonocardia sp. KRD291]MBW0104722.1 hypothetical protein [Pseudonocardia sp. KRD291]
MISYELQETRDVPGDGHNTDVPGRVPGRMRGVHGVRGVDDVRDIRSARSVRGGTARRPVPAGRGPAAPVGPAATAGSARPTETARRPRPAVRAAAFCPAPVALAPRTVVSPGVYRRRRLVAGIGVALASAAAVFGLGLLADASSAANAVPTAPVTVLHGF